MVQRPTWEINSFSASQENHQLLWNHNVHCRFHYRPPHVSCPCPHSTSLTSVLILSCHIILSFLNVLFHHAFPSKSVWTTIFSHICHMPCQFHSSLSGHANNVDSSLLRLNISTCTLFSNTRSLRSSLSLGDQVSLPYKTTGKLQFCLSRFLNFWTANWKTKDSASNDNKEFLTLVSSFFFMDGILIC